MREDIFDLAISNRESEFISDTLGSELEVFGDIIDSFIDFPFIGSLIKLGRIGKGYMDCRFMQKIAYFLSKGQDIPIEKKRQFLDSLVPKQRKMFFDYLIHYLYHAEDDEKAKIMGLLYRMRVLDEIDNNIFLRLCSIVDKAFISDLKALPQFIEENRENSIEAQSFINLGLIDNNLGGLWQGYPKTELNGIGKKLYEILNSVGWFES